MINESTSFEDLFPSTSRYLKAADIKGKSPVVKIADIRQEEVGDEKSLKTVIYFAGCEKSLVCNSTNAHALKALYGERPTAWINKDVMLTVVPSSFKGKPVDSILIVAPPSRPAQAAVPAPAPAQVSPPVTTEVADDDVPF